MPGAPAENKYSRVGGGATKIRIGLAPAVTCLTPLA